MEERYIVMPWANLATKPKAPVFFTLAPDPFLYLRCADFFLILILNP